VADVVVGSTERVRALPLDSGGPGQALGVGLHAGLAVIRFDLRFYVF